MYWRRSLARVIVGGLLLAGLPASTAAPVAAAPQVRAYIQIGPPQPAFERRPRAPGPGYVWIAGYYHHDGRSYEWVPGRWERPPRAHARWSSGHWRHGRQGWYFIEGRWR